MPCCKNQCCICTNPHMHISTVYCGHSDTEVKFVFSFQFYFAMKHEYLKSHSKFVGFQCYLAFKIQLLAVSLGGFVPFLYESEWHCLMVLTCFILLITMPLVFVFIYLFSTRVTKVFFQQELKNLFSQRLSEELFSVSPCNSVSSLPQPEKFPFSTTSESVRTMA